MKIKPVGDRILLRLKKSELAQQAEKAGISLPDKVQELERYGTQFAEVMAIGPLAYKSIEDGTPWCKVGDIVHYVKYAGENYDEIEEGFVYRIIKDVDVIGIIEEM